MNPSVEDLANQVVLLLDTFPGPILVLEGSADFRAIESSATSRVGFVIAHGKWRVLAVLERLLTEIPGKVLGLVDADYDGLKGDAVPQSVVRWDHHDLEVTCLCSPALDDVVRHFCERDKVEDFVSSCGSPLRESLLDRARPLGALRWLSERDGLGLPFKEINLARYVDPRTLDVDVQGIVKALLTKRSGSQKGAPEVILKVRGIASDGNLETRNLVSGHDVTLLLTVGLKMALASYGNSVPSVEVVERLLIAQFAGEHFRATACGSRIEGLAQRLGHPPMFRRTG